MVTVYTTNNCPQCFTTKLALKKRGIAFEQIDITGNAAMQEKLKSRGHRSMPVVVTDTDEWAGFLPHKINAIGGDE